MISITSDNHQDLNTEYLHQVKSIDGRDFIISSGEVSSLKYRLHLSGIRSSNDITSGTTPSIETLNFYDDVILVPRWKMTRFLRKYKTLQVLRETDSYLWMCRKELFKNTVTYEPTLNNHQSGLLEEIEKDILEGRANYRATNLSNEK